MNNAEIQLIGEQCSPLPTSKSAAPSHLCAVRPGLFQGSTFFFFYCCLLQPFIWDRNGSGGALRQPINLEKVCVCVRGICPVGASRKDRPPPSPLAGGLLA